MAVSVLIVDDHAAFRSSVRTLLLAAGFEVVGEAADGAAAGEAVVRLRPDVVLLDVQLPDTDGFSVADQLARAPAPPQVVLISTRDASSYRRRLRSVHALGFIAKAELSGPALTALIAR